MSDIKINPARQRKLDFSLIEGHFDNVHGSVHNGFQDKSGNIWFGTTGAGAIRYDGTAFTHLTVQDKLNNNSVTPLLEDNLGNIWFATADGIYRYDKKTFTYIPTPRVDKSDLQSFALNPSSNKDVASISVTSAMQDKQGNIWIATSINGVYCYDGKSFVALLSKKDLVNKNGLRLNTIMDIIEDRKGNIWFASWNNEGLCRYDGHALISYNSKNGLGDDMIYSLSEDKSGHIWIGTRDHGVWRYDGTLFSNISGETDLKHASIYSIEQDKIGNHWFSTEGKGVWRYDGKSFVNFTTKDGLGNNSVFCIVAENTGKLWFGTRGMGLCSYDGKTFSSYRTQTLKK